VDGVTGPASGAPVSVRLGTVADADTVARLHIALIDTGFLASLGPRFLRRLYRRMALSPDSFLLIAVGRPGETPTSDAIVPGVAGFVTGSIHLGALYRRFLLRDGVVAAAVCLPKLLRSWRLALDTLGHGTGGRGAEFEGAEMITLGVDPAWRGRHVSKALIDGFLAELTRRGESTATQLFVAEDNATALALYDRYGFFVADRYEHHRGTVSLLMRRPADTP
jgi:ribosomal protein S18 acetylase RimI-like enzyme